MAKQAVFITGGSRGIGAACVKKFAEAGFDVAFTYYRHQAEATALATANGALALRADAADKEEVARVVREALCYFGRVSFDVLICSAGEAMDALFTEYREDERRHLLDVDLCGPMYALDAVLPRMVEQKKGSIVLVSSIWGERAASCESIYAAAKAGLIALARSLAAEVGPSGIRVNAVSPGVIDTDMMKTYDEKVRQDLAEQTPLGRLGRAEEVAEAIFFLAGDKASFITGISLGVHGGFGI